MLGEGLRLIASALLLGASQVPVQVPPATPPANETTLQGTWLWTGSEYADGSWVEAADPSKYTIAFLPAGQLSIQADCNAGRASYTVTDQQLTIQPGPMTLVACEPGSQDSVFLRDLRSVASYGFDDEHLVLNLAADGGRMIFAPMPPVQLSGLVWRVTGINNGREAVVSVVADTQLTAQFGADGTLTGETGCNTYRGPYVIAGSTISVGPLATTRRACLSDAAATQEQAFLAALAATTSYELTGDRLTLRDAGGATQMTLVRPTLFQ